MDVLIVDDMADIRLMLRTCMQFRTDMRVVAEASDGASAIRLARDLLPDVIVLDRHMDPLGGDAAISLLREVAPDAAIVIYSAFVADPSDRAELIGLGADAVVEKASLFVNLEDAIRTALAVRAGA